MAMRMQGRQWVIALPLVMAAGQIGCSQISHEPLVDIADMDSRIVVEIKYATADNFMGRPLYPANRCLLRESVARRLSRVQDDLAERGRGLKIHDGYRPLSVQKLMWEVLPDERYVANPAKGSRHNRGAAVDVTLVDAWGRELPMPCPYDEFSPRAHRTYAAASLAERRNRDLLIEAMERRGFRGLDTEWWHFDAPGWQQYAVLDVPLREWRMMN
jgi:D-alanyl-D-alanine dipeptidase